VRLIQPAFAAGEISPSLGGRVDLAKYKIALKTCRNFIVHRHGGASNRGGTQYLNNTLGNAQARLIPFEFSVEQNYVLEFTEKKLRVFKDGALVESTPGVPLEVVSPFTLEQILEARYTQSADVMYLVHPDVAPQDLTRTSHTAWTFAVHGTTGPTITSGMSIFSSVFTAPNRAAITITAITAADPAQITSVGHGLVDDFLIRITGVVGTMGAALNEKIFRVKNLSPVDPDNFQLMDINGNPFSTAGLTYTSGGSAEYPKKTLYYKVIAVNDAGEESPNGLAVSTAVVGNPWLSGAEVVLTWNAAVGGGITGYNIYRSDNFNSIFGFIGYTTGLTFRDDNIAPDYTDSPQISQTPFTGAGNYPGAVAIFQQRLVLARTDSQPQTVFASQTGLFSNFSTSDPLKDSDAIEATIASRQVNEIRHLVPIRQLLVMTSSTEWLCGANGPITPTDISFDVQGYRGSSDVPPVVIGNTVLFLQRGGQVVRDLRYQLQDDSYTGDDLSVMSPHLFEGRNIIAWAYQGNPDSILWCVRDDGVLLGLTYLREQEIWAWHRHDTNGLFESICSLPGDPGQPDEVYVVVKRLVNGSWVRFVEQFRDRLPDDDLSQAYFVDAGLSWDNPVVVSGFSGSGTNLVTTATAHGLATGDYVRITELLGAGVTGTLLSLDDLNDTWFEVEVVDATSFRIRDITGPATIPPTTYPTIDAALYSAYISGGKVRRGVTTISGMDHLAEMEVAVLADGNVLSLTVSAAGVVTLPRRFATVHIGLPYTADLETLELEEQGQLSGKRRQTRAAILRLLNTRGVFVGSDEDHLLELKLRGSEGYLEATRMFTGDKDIAINTKWARSARIMIRQSDPLPVTVLMTVPEVEVEED